MEASTQRLQQVVESLTGNEALTDQLDDAGAQALLAWGIAYGKAVVENTANLPDADDAAQPRLQAIRRLLRAVNSYFTPAAEAVDSEPQAQSTATSALLQRVVEQVAIIEGDRFAKPDEAQVATFAAELAQQAATPQAFITALRHFFEQPAPPPTPVADSSTTPSPTLSTESAVTPPATLGGDHADALPSVPVAESSPAPTPTSIAASPAPTTILRTDWLRRVFSQLRRFYRQPQQ